MTANFLSRKKLVPHTPEMLRNSIATLFSGASPGEIESRSPFVYVKAEGKLTEDGSKVSYAL